MIAAANGHINILERFLKGLGWVFDEYVIETAVEHGQLDTLKWFLENTNIRNIQMISIWAARHGQVEILNWLWNQNIPFHRFVPDVAATKGQVDVLNLLRQALFANQPQTLHWFSQRGYHPPELGRFKDINVPEELRTRQRLPQTFEETRIMLPYITPSRTVDRNLYYTEPELVQIARNLGLSTIGIVDNAVLAQRLQNYLQQ
jgi:hypothetical protein